MPDFNLPAGCSMRITASMETTAVDRRRWSVAIYAVGGPQDADPRSRYGARIVGGQTQKLDTPPIAVDCVCQVQSSSETGGDWLDDVAKVSTEADELTMTFTRPPEGGEPGAGGECVLTFRFNPAVALA
jgi:hypothetical protein